VHGFGFSFALREQLQFAGTHLLTSLLAFNVGVEIAQVVVIVSAATAVTLAFRRLSSPRVAAIVVSAIAAHTGWDWLLEREPCVGWQYPWPVPSPAALAGRRDLVGSCGGRCGGRMGRSPCNRRQRPRQNADRAQCLANRLNAGSLFSFYVGEATESVR
jgi:hypothetical protein